MGRAVGLPGVDRARCRRSCHLGPAPAAGLGDGAGLPEQDRIPDPGSTSPGELAAVDPVATWRQARDEANGVLDEETLARRITLPGLGEIPLSAMATLLVTDFLGHTWDIGHPLGMDVRLDPALVPLSYAWAQQSMSREPGFFGPELTPPPGADEQTRLLAFLGRAA
nr:hypothetical protein [Fodinicola feengrottensis]